MLKPLLALTILSITSASHAGAADELRLRKQDELRCEWVQHYVDVPIASCLRSNDEMFIVPTHPITRAVAIDLLASSAVAAEMQKSSPKVLTVALKPDMTTFIRVTGNPVRFDGTSDRKGALRALSKAAVDCKLKNWDTICSDGSIEKLKPIN